MFITKHLTFYLQTNNTQNKSTDAFIYKYIYLYGVSWLFIYMYIYVYGLC